MTMSEIEDANPEDFWDDECWTIPVDVVKPGLWAKLLRDAEDHDKL